MERLEIVGADCEGVPVLDLELVVDLVVSDLLDLLGLEGIELLDGVLEGTGVEVSPDGELEGPDGTLL